MVDNREPVELAGQVSALAEAVNAGAVVPAGRLYGLPELSGGDCWVDMAGAAALTGVPPRTITSWLSRGGPVRNPFPLPRRLLYRLYWPRDDIESWKDRETNRD
jgi:predicted DNA-binding transcriptional regulator AlpA